MRTLPLTPSSMSFIDGLSSVSVSLELGYRPDGITRDVLHGKVVESQRFRPSRDDRHLHEPPPVTVNGSTGCEELFGVSGGGAAPGAAWAGSSPRGLLGKTTPSCARRSSGVVAKHRVVSRHVV